MTREQEQDIDYKFSHNCQTLLECQARWANTFDSDDEFDLVTTAGLIYDEELE